MSEMVERVARALAPEAWAGLDRERKAFPADPYARFLEAPPIKRSLDDARVAIEAMREEDLRTELAARKFEGQVSRSENGCWQWKGAIDRRDGYGRFYGGGGKTISAHQFAYARAKGDVPPGLVIDHTCRNRACVNPDHLRAVTNAENVLCGEGPTARFARATVCGRGHELTEENLYYRPNGQRMCRPCQQERSRRSKANRRAALSPTPPG